MKGISNLSYSSIPSIHPLAGSQAGGTAAGCAANSAWGVGPPPPKRLGLYLTLRLLKGLLRYSSILYDELFSLEFTFSDITVFCD